MVNLLNVHVDPTQFLKLKSSNASLFNTTKYSTEMEEPTLIWQIALLSKSLINQMSPQLNLSL